MYRKLSLWLGGLAVLLLALYVGFWFYVANRASHKIESYINEQLPFQQVAVSSTGFPFSWRFDVKVATKEGQEATLSNIDTNHKKITFFEKIQPLLRLDDKVKLEDNQLVSSQKNAQPIQLSAIEQGWLTTTINLNAEKTLTQNDLNALQQLKINAEKELKDLNLPLVYRIEDFSIQPDFFVTQVSLNPTLKHHAYAIQAKNIDISFKHSLFGSLMSGSDLNKTLEEQVSSINIEGAVNQQSFKLDINNGGMSSDTPTVQVKTENALAILSAHSSKEQQLSASSMSLIFSNQSSIAQLIQLVYNAHTMPFKQFILANPDFINNLIIEKATVKHDEQTTEISSLSPSINVSSLDSALKIGSINIKTNNDAVAVEDLHLQTKVNLTDKILSSLFGDKNNGVTSSLDARLTGTISPKAWRLLQQWPLALTDKIDLSFLTPYMTQTHEVSLQLHGDIKSQEADTYKLTAFSYQPENKYWAITESPAPISVIVSKDKTIKLSADTLRINVSDPSVLSSYLEQYDINPKSLLPANVILNHLEIDSSDSSTDAKVSDAAITWGNNSQFKTAKGGDLTKLTSAGLNGELQLNDLSKGDLEQLWLKPDGLQAYEFSSELMPLYQLIIDISNKPIIKDTSLLNNELDKLLSNDQSLVKNLTTYHTLLSQYEKLDWQLKSEQASKLNHHDGEDVNLDQLKEERDNQKTLLDSFNRDNSKVSQQYKKFTDFINSKSQAQNMIVITDLSINENGKTFIQQKADSQIQQALKSWLFHGGEKPVLLNVNDKALVIPSSLKDRAILLLEHEQSKELAKQLIKQAYYNGILGGLNDNARFTLKADIDTQDHSFRNIDVSVNKQPVLSVSSWKRDMINDFQWNSNPNIKTASWLRLFMHATSFMSGNYGTIDLQQPNGLTAFDLGASIPQDMIQGLTSILNTQTVFMKPIDQWFSAEFKFQQYDANSHTLNEVSWFDGAKKVTAKQLQESAQQKPKEANKVQSFKLFAKHHLGDANAVLPGTVNYDHAQGKFQYQQDVGNSNRIASMWDYQNKEGTLIFTDVSNNKLKNSYVNDDVDLSISTQSEQGQWVAQVKKVAGAVNQFSIMLDDKAVVTFDSNQMGFNHIKWDKRVEALDLPPSVSGYDAMLQQNLKAIQVSADKLGFPYVIEGQKTWDAVDIAFLKPSLKIELNTINASLGNNDIGVEINNENDIITMDIGFKSLKKDDVRRYFRETLNQYLKNRNDQALLDTRFNLITNSDYACTDWRIQSDPNKQKNVVSISCANDRKLSLTQDNNEGRLTFTSSNFKPSETNNITSLLSAVMNITEECRSLENDVSQLNSLFSDCLESSVNGESNICDVSEIKTIWNDCHAGQ
ncbi:MAG: hypothetical protein ACON5A_05160 [Candidatus Comchoanobacterales bacterium]